MQQLRPTCLMKWWVAGVGGVPGASALSFSCGALVLRSRAAFLGGRAALWGRWGSGARQIKGCGYARTDRIRWGGEATEHNGAKEARQRPQKQTQCVKRGRGDERRRQETAPPTEQQQQQQQQQQKGCNRGGAPPIDNSVAARAKKWTDKTITTHKTRPQGRTETAGPGPLRQNQQQQQQQKRQTWGGTACR